MQYEWVIKNKEIGRLEIPHRYAATKPLITQQQRLELIRNCIDSTASPLRCSYQCQEGTEVLSSSRNRWRA
jgi:hypothetical protein